MSEALSLSLWDRGRKGLLAGEGFKDSVRSHARAPLPFPAATKLGCSPQRRPHCTVSSGEGGAGVLSKRQDRVAGF